MAASDLLPSASAVAVQVSQISARGSCRGLYWDPFYGGSGGRREFAIGVVPSMDAGGGSAVWGDVATSLQVRVLPNRHGHGYSLICFFPARLGPISSISWGRIAQSSMKSRTHPIRAFENGDLEFSIW